VKGIAIAAHDPFCLGHLAPELGIVPQEPVLPVSSLNQENPFPNGSPQALNDLLGKDDAE